MLCVNYDRLKTSSDVQRDVNLAEILVTHTKYYPNVESALKDHYVPLNVCMSLRTVYTNQIMQTQLHEGCVRYYVNVTDIQPCIHKGYDLVMFLSSVALMQCMKDEYTDNLGNIMLRSEFMPIGLYNPDPLIVNPMVYSHIILADDMRNKLSELFKDTVQFVSISEVRNNHVGNIKALIDTFVEVKGGQD